MIVTFLFCVTVSEVFAWLERAASAIAIKAIVFIFFLLVWRARQPRL